MSREPPLWLIPFEPSVDLWRKWLRRLASPAVVREIASADYGYDPGVEEALDTYLTTWVHTEPVLWETGECLELVSNHYYIDDRNSSQTMAIGGAICVTLVALRQDYSPLAMEGRIGRISETVLARSPNDQLALLHLFAWASSNISKEHWIAQSMFAFPSLALAASIANGQKRRRRKSDPTAWITDEFVESLAEQVQGLIEADMRHYKREFLHEPVRWFVSLDSEQQQFVEWWRICRELKNRLDPIRFRRTVQLVDRIYEDRFDTWKA